MKQIPLTQGKFTLVDDADFEWLNQIKWQAQVNHCGIFYAVNSHKRLRMHRVIMGLRRGDKRQVDHINHNALDNRRCNLRICTNSQNCMNGRQKGGSSKYKGVTYHKKSGKWQSQIMLSCVHRRLGSYDTEELAALAYNKAAQKHFGDFAYLNKVGVNV